MAKFEPLARHEELAGKTVYFEGMNVHYLPNGYHHDSYNPDWKEYMGTTRSIHAQPVEDALAGKEWIENWTGYVDWNWGNPDRSTKLTAENEAAAREAFYAEQAKRDEEKVKLSMGIRDSENGAIG